MDLFDGLNAPQRDAVTTTEGPLLILAGAGTGKTGVLTRRIAYLIKEKKVSPRHILAVTFTNKSADEMKERVEKFTGLTSAELWVSTFHAFCARVLQESGAKIGIEKEFKQFDPVEQWIFLRRLLPNLKLDYFLELTDPYGVIHDFIRFISRAKDELIFPDDYLAYAQKKKRDFEQKYYFDYDVLSPFLKVDRYRRTRPSLVAGWTQEQWLTMKEEGLEVKKMLEMGEIYQRYQAEMSKGGNLDFGDLIVSCYRLFSEFPDVLREYQQRFQYILVDEFQDTNIAQIELLRLLSQQHQNICVVGDDDQAIYRFRGASYASFVNFKKLFPNAKIIKLTQNYRSTKNILTASSTLIAHNAGARYDPEKNLWTEKEKGGAVTILLSGDFPDEAHAIATLIEKGFDGLSTSERDYSKFAVLYRAHAHRDLITEEFDRRGVPYIIVSPEGLLQTQVIQDLLAYLRVLRNIKIGVSQETVSLVKLLSGLQWQITPVELYAIFNFAIERKLSVYEALKMPEQIPLLHQETVGRLKAFGQSRDEFYAKLNDEISVYNFVEFLISKTPYNMAELERRNTVESQQQMRILGEFLQFVKEKSEIEENKSFLNFMEYVDYYVEAGGTLQPTAIEGELYANAVKCMTVHAAKGLEFEHVFVINLTANRFPTRRRKEAVTFPPELMKEEIPQGDIHLQEERRLFYVAMTRGKEKLYLSAIDKRHSPKSRFVVEVGSIHDDYLEVRNIEPHPKIAEPSSESMRWFAPSIQTTLFPKQEKLRLSFSQIDMYQTCPQKYKFRYIYKIPTPPRGYFIYGGVQHRVLEEFFQKIKNGEPVSAQTLEQLYEYHWQQGGYLDTLQQTEYKKRGYEELREFYEQHKETFRAPLALEEDFNFTVDGHRITGRIDRIDALGEDGVEVIDYKTGKPRNQENADKSLQLSIYAIAVKEKLNKESKLLSFYYLTSNEKISSTRSEQDLETTKGKILNVAEQILAENFKPCKGNYCDWCDYKPICPEWNRHGIN